MEKERRWVHLCICLFAHLCKGCITCLFKFIIAAILPVTQSKKVEDIKKGLESMKGV